jgi:hypothetical protein
MPGMPGPNIRIDEFIQSYCPLVVVWIVLASILALPHYSFVSSLIQIFSLLFLIYISHIIIHTLIPDTPLIILNPHIFLHHNKEVIVEKWIERSVEAISNFWYCFSLILFQYMFSLSLVSTSIILYASVLYVITHIFDYSIYGNEKHSLHHKYSFCNYEPEVFDALFGTRCIPELPYTDMTIEIPHAILAFVIVVTLKFTLDLD